MSSSKTRFFFPSRANSLRCLIKSQLVRFSPLAHPGLGADGQTIEDAVFVPEVVDHDQLFGRLSCRTDRAQSSLRQVLCIEQR